MSALEYTKENAKLLEISYLTRDVAAQRSETNSATQFVQW